MNLETDEACAAGNENEIVRHLYDYEIVSLLNYCVLAVESNDPRRALQIFGLGSHRSFEPYFTPSPSFLLLTE
jgi:hypothetical protein